MSNRYRSKIRNLLIDGYGVEDIGLMLHLDVDFVREIVAIFRGEGSLEDIVRRGQQ